MASASLDPLFNPSSLAVFGASASGRSVGAMVFANLVEGGFDQHPGRGLLAINPKYGEVLGRPCHPSLDKVPASRRAKIDLAVIATPAATVPAILHQCGEAGIGHAIILSAGFGEAGSEEGTRLASEVAQAAAQHGIRYLGPNCVGLVRPWLDLDATFLNSVTPKGNLALVSQSGALCSAISDWAAPHDLGFSALVSLGNSADIGFGDAIRFLATDPQTDAILLYVEGVRDARSFMSALRLATRVKPVIVLKAGRHNKSSQAAHTHTGALIGSDEVFEAALERAGAVRVDTFGQLFAAAEILASGTHVGGNRLAIITNGGGAGVLAADRAGDLGIELPAPAPQTIAELGRHLSPYWSKANPVDILGDAGAGAYAAALKCVLADPAFDGALVMLTPQAMTDALSAAEALINAIPDAGPVGNRKPVLACWMGETSVADARKLLSKSGIPDFRVPERAVEAFSYLARHRRNTRLALEVPGPRSAAGDGAIEAAQGIIARVIGEGRDMLSDMESKQLLDAFGIPVNRTFEAADPASACEAAAEIGFPVAMKISSPDISHKSDIGGVRLGISGEAAVRAAFGEIIGNATAALPEARIRGVTVEPMARISHPRELVAGMSSDPVFGPTILFGAGGTMVELLRDSAVSLPPLNSVLAARLIDRTRVSRLLDAFRDKPAVRREAVIDVLLRLSDLVCECPEIRELDINPLLAGSNGVVAVDARIRVAPLPEGLPRHAGMAIRPWPRELVSEHVLRNGSQLIIRPIRPEDAQGEREFVIRLSPATRQSRFMHSMKELSPSMLVRFTQIDYDREMALVALTRDGSGKEVQQGVARYTINRDDISCEFAIVVSDELQNQGVGTLLMKALIDAARQHGLEYVRGSVLAANHAMLELMKDLGFAIQTSSEERGVMDVSLEI